MGMRNRTIVLGLMAILGSLAAGAAPAPAVEGGCPVPEPMTFAPQGYVEMERAGGEPTITTLPDGTLLYGAHAATTHFYTPAAADPATLAFGQNYTGQTYIWRSTDDGKSWTFIDRTLPAENLPLSGFSDPEWAIDAAGQVYTSEINLANIAVSKSSDGGQSFALQNFFGQTVSDRQWKAADQKDELYIVGNAFAGGTFPNDPVGNTGHFLYKSVDGGKNFSPGLEDGNGLGDIQVDPRTGTLYETYYGGTTLSMAAYRDIRGKADLDGQAPDVKTIAGGVSMLGHWPSFALDGEGNLYVTWDESGDGARAAGVYFATSTDEGRTWSSPTRVDTGDKTNIWPWLTVGDRGRVAIAYLEADVALPNHNAEIPGDHGWRIIAAQTLDGLGCAGFSQSVATPDPIHTGTICQGGTICQAEAVDRRLGDFFTISTDRNGHVWMGYSDTRQGGAVALPGVVHQSGGPSMTGGGGSASGPAPSTAPTSPAPSQGGSLRVTARLARSTLGRARRRGVTARLGCTEACRGTAVLRIGRRKAVAGKVSFALGKAGSRSVRIRLNASGRRALRRAKRVGLVLTVSARDAAGRRAPRVRARATLRR